MSGAKKKAAKVWRTATLTNKKAGTSLSWLFKYADLVHYVAEESISARIEACLEEGDILQDEDGRRVAMVATIVRRVNRRICDTFPGCTGAEAKVLRALADECDTMTRTILARARGPKRLVLA